jgi:hypothetical protein
LAAEWSALFQGCIYVVLRVSPHFHVHPNHLWGAGRRVGGERQISWCDALACEWRCHGAVGVADFIVEEFTTRCRKNTAIAADVSRKRGQHLPVLAPLFSIQRGLQRCGGQCGEWDGAAAAVWWNACCRWKQQPVARGGWLPGANGRGGGERERERARSTFQCAAD